MKMENVCVGLEGKAKRSFYNPNLVGVKGTILGVTGGGFVVVGYDKQYTTELQPATTTYNKKHFFFLTKAIKQAK